MQIKTKNSKNGNKKSGIFCYQHLKQEGKYKEQLHLEEKIGNAKCKIRCNSKKFCHNYFEKQERNVECLYPFISTNSLSFFALHCLNWQCKLLLPKQSSKNFTASSWHMYFHGCQQDSVYVFQLPQLWGARSSASIIEDEGESNFRKSKMPTERLILFAKRNKNKAEGGVSE